MWRLIYAIPMWILFALLVGVLALIGWVVIPIAAGCRAYTLRTIKDGEEIWDWSWRLMWLWGNNEDGIDNGLRFMQKDKFWSRFTKYKFARILYWTANRNPVNNLRFIPILKCDIEPKNVRWVGSLGSYEDYMTAPLPNGIDPYDYDDKRLKEYSLFCWHGAYSCYRKQYKNKSGEVIEFWIGWKIWPQDIFGVSEFRATGAGVAFQWRAL